MKIYMMRYTPEAEEPVIIAFSSKRERIKRLSFETRMCDYSCAYDDSFEFWEIDMKPTTRDMIELFNNPYACRVC